jgi:hypothetical protein
MEIHRIYGFPGTRISGTRVARVRDLLGHGFDLHPTVTHIIHTRVQKQDGHG